MAEGSDSSNFTGMFKGLQGSYIMFHPNNVQFHVDHVMGFRRMEKNGENGRGFIRMKKMEEGLLEWPQWLIWPSLHTISDPSVFFTQFRILQF
jgi:hypothetical protein